MAAAGPRWAIQQLLCVMSHIDTGPLSAKRAVWTARGMPRRPSVRSPRRVTGALGRKAFFFFFELGGRGEN